MKVICGLLTALLPTLAEGDSYLNGRFVAVTDVSDRSLISEDIRGIRDAADIDTARNIYQNGLNSVKTDGSVRSLQDLATSGEAKMMKEQEYRRVHHALTKTKAGASPFATADYANKFVLDSLQGGSLNLAASASHSLIVWMYTVHELRDAIADCISGDLTANQGKVKALEEAVAFYVGANQEIGSKSGNSLYTLAQSAAEKFGTLDGIEAIANRDFIALANEAQSKMTAEDGTQLSLTLATCLEVRQVVDKMVAVMTIPLVQELIYHMNQSDHRKIREYALAVVPFIEGCSTHDYDVLFETLIVNYEDFNFQSDYDSTLAMLQKAYPCLGITCEDIGVTDLTSSCVDVGINTPIAGYVPSTDVREHNKLDLDVLQMHLFADDGGLDVATEIYKYGRNSRKGDSYRTLQTLATTAKRTVVPSYSTFTTYFGSDNDYADTIITDALSKSGEFQGASPAQLTELVTKTTQYMVVYMYVLRELYDALDDCRSGSPTDNVGNVKAVDEAWAFAVGSIEGPTEKTNPAGQMLFALGEKRCEAFGTCNEDGSAKVNSDLLVNFRAAQESMSSLDCDGLEGDIKKIEPLLLVPFVQGALRYAVLNVQYQAQETDGDIAEAFVFSRSHLPLVKEAAPAAASVIESNLGFTLDSKPVPDGTDAVFDAYRQAIPAMGLDCAMVGTHESGGSLCAAPAGGDADGDGDASTGTTGGASEPSTSATTIDPNEPTELGGGLFVTSTNVLDRARIAKDKKRMMDLLLSGDVTSAQEIYENGENSKKYDTSGELTGKIRTFQGFSTAAATKMDLEPLFHIYAFSLGARNQGSFLGRDVNLYADTYVENIFPKSTMAGEAVVALHLWMYTVHELEDALQDCLNAEQVSVAEIALKDNGGGVLALDEAAAFYIGTDQTRGDPDGQLLYALAEQGAANFGTKVDGEASVNTKVLKMLNEAKTVISFADACTAGSGTYERLRLIVDKIKSQMTVPLIQSLIKAMQDNDQDRVKLYALSIVPLIASCNPDIFEYLYDELLESTYNAAKFDNIVSVLQEAYPCLKITCEDVGAHSGESPCAPPTEFYPIAGYVPTTDVREHAKLDVDILQIKIFMKRGAKAVAKDVYMYGRNSMKDGKFRKLHNLATNSNRAAVPQLRTFKEYHDGDDEYADALINEIFTDNDRSRFDGASVEQQYEVVAKTIQYQVMYMYVLREMYDAHGDCLSGDPQRNAGRAKAWDEAVAFFVGSLEGPEKAGSDVGESIYNLNKKRCQQFDTCESGDAAANVKIMDLFLEGQKKVDQNDCTGINSIIKKLEPLMITGMIQGTMRYALANNRLGVGSTDGDLAEGDIFYTAIAPLVRKSKPKSDELIWRNLQFQLEYSPVPEGTKAVFQALADALPGMNVKCEDMGEDGGLDVCSPSTLATPAAQTASGAVARGGIVSMVCIAVGAMIQAALL